MGWKLTFLFGLQIKKKNPTNSKHSHNMEPPFPAFLFCVEQKVEMDESQVLQCTKYKNDWTKTCTCLNSFAYTYATEESIIPKASAF